MSLLLAAGSGEGTTTLAPGEGAVVASGQAASITFILAVAVGSVAMAGNAPSITQVKAPGQGAVVIAGQTPALQFARAPGEGAVALGGNVPSVVVGTILSPTEGSIVAAGNAPAIQSALVPVTGAAALAGEIPALARALQPNDGAVVVAGDAPTLTLVISEPEETFRPGGKRGDDDEAEQVREKWAAIEAVQAVDAAHLLQQAKPEVATVVRADAPVRIAVPTVVSPSTIQDGEAIEKSRRIAILLALSEFDD